MVVYVVTGTKVSDGDAYCWVERVAKNQKDAYDAIDVAKKAYQEDYGEDPDEEGVAFDVHPMEVYE